MKTAFRVFGVWMMIAAFIMVVVDGTRSIASDRLMPTMIGEAWYVIDSAGLTVAQAAVERYVAPVLWDPVITTILTVPLFVLLALLAALFLWIGRRRRRVDIFINEP